MKLPKANAKNDFSKCLNTITVKAVKKCYLSIQYCMKNICAKTGMRSKLCKSSKDPQLLNYLFNFDQLFDFI